MGHVMGFVLLVGAFAMLRRLRPRRAWGCHGRHRRFGSFGPFGPGGGYYRGMHTGGPYAGGFLSWILADLHLTPEQEGPVGEILSDARASAGRVREAASGLRQ